MSSSWSPFDGLFGRKLVDLKRDMERKRQREERRQRIQAIRLNRVELEIRASLAGRESNVLQFESPREIVYARLVGQDFGLEGMRVFCNQPILEGSEVAVTLLGQQRLYVRGRIKWCHALPYPMTQILTEREYRFRAEIVFDFGSSEEQREVQSFIREFQTRYVLGAR